MYRLSRQLHIGGFFVSVPAHKEAGKIWNRSSLAKTANLSHPCTFDAATDAHHLSIIHLPQPFERIAGLAAVLISVSVHNWCRRGFAL